MKVNKYEEFNNNKKMEIIEEDFAKNEQEIRNGKNKEREIKIRIGNCPPAFIIATDLVFVSVHLDREILKTL